MKTKKSLIHSQLQNKIIDCAISKFSQRLMSNSKWVKLIDGLVENSENINKIQFKKVQTDKIGELYLDENSIYEFDYWHSGFEGNNSFGEWLEYKEIEYLIFPKIVSSENVAQDLNHIKSIIDKIGQFDIEINDIELKLICYKI